MIRYTIPLDSTSSNQAHRLGVNSLAIDPTQNGTLYSAGRDGIIAAWDLKMDLSRIPNRYAEDDFEMQVDGINGHSTCKQGIQAHTNWVNQIGISPNYQNIYSCSSDATVKVWRPNSSDNHKPDNIGSHTDYVKCLVVPKFSTEWIATAGLDRSTIIWDTSGKGERMRIDGQSRDGTMKQSIYSLAAGPNLLITGGIEKVMRVWDMRSASRISKLIGHTDNVRSILCSDDGTKVISASSDSTIKIWDLVAGRCLHTLTMHSDPVWTLLSDHPALSVFHAGDKAGLLTKTDMRAEQVEDSGEGACTAICREDSGINGIAILGDRIFTATAKSSINRWRDTETEHSNPFADPRASPKLQTLRADSAVPASRRLSNIANGVRRPSSVRNHAKPNKIHFGIQPMAATIVPHGNSLRKSSLWSASSVVSLALSEDEESSAYSLELLEPLRNSPETTIKGQAGLIQHVLLSDRMRVLTQDTDGCVTLWDITQCKQINDYGKVDMEKIEQQLQSQIAIGSWCSVNTKLGALTVELDPRNMLDAETYFDAVTGNDQLDFETRNQRFNIGKWMLKALFQSLVDAEKERDSRSGLRARQRRPDKLDLSSLSSTVASGHQEASESAKSSFTFGSKNPYASAMATPGTSLGLTAPLPVYTPKGATSTVGHQHHGSLSSMSSSSNPSSPVVTNDYFGGSHGSKDPDATPMGNNEPPTPGSMPKTPGGSLMKNIKWLRNSKTPKASLDLKRTSSATPMAIAPLTASAVEVTAPQNCQEFITQQRKMYQARPGVPPLTTENKPEGWVKFLEPMPNLVLPPNVDLSLAHFQPGEGEAKDTYRGTLASLPADLSTATLLFPVWLGQILLLNEVPVSMQNTESNKHYFTFAPHHTSSLQDPFNSSPTNLMRLGAARSLRIRKALTYISQRLPAETVEKEGESKNEENWLEIVVNNTPVDPDWTLLMARRHLWKQGGDMKLEYRLQKERT